MGITSLLLRSSALRTMREDQNLNKKRKNTPDYMLMYDIISNPQVIFETLIPRQLQRVFLALFALGKNMPMLEKKTTKVQTPTYQYIISDWVEKLEIPPALYMRFLNCGNILMFLANGDYLYYKYYPLYLDAVSHYLSNMHKLSGPGLTWISNTSAMCSDSLRDQKDMVKLVEHGKNIEFLLPYTFTSMIDNFGKKNHLKSLLIFVQQQL